MELYSLGSGSSGNAFVVESGETSLLVDCGVGARVLRKTLQDLDLVGRLSGVLISHEHTDHIRTLPSLARYDGCPVHASRGTLAAIGREAHWLEFRAGTRFSIGEVAVTPVLVSHDAAEPCGFMLEGDDSTVAIFTDLGVTSADVRDALSAADIVILESNYCDRMMRSSRYPAFVKQRIRGPEGHLSNDSCAEFLADAIGERTRSIWLAHLSKNNNDPDLAVETTTAALASRGEYIPVTALPRYDTLPLHAASGERVRQGTLI